MDPAAVDPAILQSQTKTSTTTGGAQRAAPSFPPTAVIIKDDPEAALESFNWESHVAVSCAEDSVLVSLPKASAEKIPIISQQIAAGDNKAAAFDFRSSALVAVNHWVEKKGVEGKSTVEFPTPCLHTDICMLLNDDWEKHFARSVLLTSAENAIAVINAAEKMGLAHLHNFAIVALSCHLRGKTEMGILQSLNKADPYPQQQLDDVSKAYPWFDEMTKAQ